MPAEAAILSIGDELALGQTLDTNSGWIADRLFSIGVRVREHITVEDDLSRMTSTLQRLASSYSVVIMTGGLGPTADDLTRQALAALLGEQLVEDETAMQHLEDWFKGRGGMTDLNRSQALRPASCVCLDNPNGTAPGLRGRLTGNRSGPTSGTEIFCLPGPPHEMKPMFSRFVEPYAATHVEGITRARLLLTFGLGESRIAEILHDLMDRDRESRGLPVIGTTASLGVVTIRIRAHATSESKASIALDSAESTVRDRLAQAGASSVLFDRRDFASGDSADISDALPRSVVGLLREQDERVATVESCTGGLLGGMITSVPGSSEVFVGGWQTYSNETKSGLVGVDPDIFASDGAVSAACAISMCRGALARLDEAGVGCDHALSVTGVAGPDGGSDEKPVGTVWIGLASRETDGIATEARRFAFKGGRDAVRGWAVRAALGMLRQRVLGGDSIELLGEVERLIPPS